MSWKVTVRRGSEVERERFRSLAEALAEARRRVDEIVRGERLGTVRMLREFTPDQQVHARIEITGPGLIRRPDGGVDVMGNGAAIAYRGAISKQQLGADSLDQAFEKLSEALGGADG